MYVSQGALLENINLCAVSLCADKEVLVCVSKL